MIVLFGVFGLAGLPLGKVHVIDGINVAQGVFVCLCGIVTVRRMCVVIPTISEISLYTINAAKLAKRKW